MSLFASRYYREGSELVVLTWGLFCPQGTSAIVISWCQDLRAMLASSRWSGTPTNIPQCTGQSPEAKEPGPNGIPVSSGWKKFCSSTGSEGQLVPLLKVFET